MSTANASLLDLNVSGTPPSGDTSEESGDDSNSLVPVSFLLFSLFLVYLTGLSTSCTVFYYIFCLLLFKNKYIHIVNID